MLDLLIVFAMEARSSGEQALERVAPPIVQGSAPASDSDALAAEYAGAYQAWRAELKAARKDKARKDEIEAAHPARTYWPRFEALVASDARAYLWMIAHADEVVDGKDAVAAKRRELFTRAVTDHSGEPWMPELIEAIPSYKKALGPASVEELHLAIAAKATDREIAGAALVQLAELKSGREATPEDLAQAKALAARVQAECPGTTAAKRAQDLVFQLEHLRVGCSAPDFEARDGDGAAFKLSDYRGKVVLLDFWGFW
jgi:hypothetical protein